MVPNQKLQISPNHCTCVFACVTAWPLDRHPQTISGTRKTSQAPFGFAGEAQESHRMQPCWLVFDTIPSAQQVGTRAFMCIPKLCVSRFMDCFRLMASDQQASDCVVAQSRHYQLTRRAIFPYVLLDHVHHKAFCICCRDGRSAFVTMLLNCK